MQRFIAGRLFVCNSRHCHRNVNTKVDEIFADGLLTYSRFSFVGRAVDAIVGNPRDSAHPKTSNTSHSKIQTSFDILQKSIIFEWSNERHEVKPNNPSGW